MAAISQREARRLRKRVEELERQIRLRNNAWVRDYPGGINIASCVVDPAIRACLITARRLNHAVVVTVTDDRVWFYALPEAQS